jgi:hypothetical protein
MRLQSPHHLAKERLLDEATQGDLGNLPAENLAGIIACRTFMSGRVMSILMSFLILAGLADLDLSIMAGGSTTCSREWM